MPDNEEDNGMTEELATAVKAAYGAAKNAPGFEPAAFGIVLTHVLGRGAPSLRTKGPQGVVRESTTRRSPRPPVSAASQVTRIQASSDGAPEAVSKYAELLSPHQAKFKIYGVIRFARDELAADGLTVPEIRFLLNDKMRFGVPQGTMTSNLTKAPPTEIGRSKNQNGETTYRLMQGGDKALDEALRSTKGDKDA